MNRRRFIENSGLFIFGVPSCLSAQASGAPTPKTQPLLSGAKKNQANGVVSAGKDKAGFSPLPFRSHEALHHRLNQSQAFVIGRSPSNKIALLDLNSQQLIRTLTTQKDQHFMGHGVCDNQYLMTTEWNYVKNLGRIGQWDLKTHQLIQHLPSFGLGPHQIKRFKNHLLVANGGLQTHPSTGKHPLNLSAMAPNVSLIEMASGTLKHQWFFEEQKASIRHLDVAPDGTFAVAMQVHRAACTHDQPIPLTARGEITAPMIGNGEPTTQTAHKLPRSSLTPFSTPMGLLTACKDYTGSIAIHAPSLTVAATSPKGGLVIFWRLDTLEFLGYHALWGACGLGIDTQADLWVVTNSQGHVHYIDPYTLKPKVSLNQYYPNISFDNHVDLPSNPVLPT